MTEFLINDFYKRMEHVEFGTYGMIDTKNRIHTFGTDSKMIGRIFEMFAQPILADIAKEYGMQLETPSSQTIYPDFIFMKSRDSKEKIAIDIKSTYINGPQSTIKFTLGSYGSYMRNNVKNIQYKYTDYVKHFVIGFVYKRNGAAQESLLFDYEDREKIEVPYTDVHYFIQEKYKIAGDKPGSGNTENIGSFVTKNFTDLKEGRGPFCELGPDVFNLYWKYYPRYRSAEKPYTCLAEFFEWLPKQGERLSLLYPYNHELLLKKIAEFQAGYH